eukprot:TRINITY_DN5796_c0_g1_i1.p1 TRINITY_DN5796_c0_g1~~TRINITY_DN5796_c0_g1_i1.p1  ORF type:complete len:126 (-),score=13.40 TRINITY_DN5796_c0_g1_i1:113-490(-)
MMKQASWSCLNGWWRFGFGVCGCVFVRGGWLAPVRCKAVKVILSKRYVCTMDLREPSKVKWTTPLQTIPEEAEINIPAGTNDQADSEEFYWNLWTSSYHQSFQHGTASFTPQLCQTVFRHHASIG